MQNERLEKLILAFKGKDKKQKAVIIGLVIAIFIALFFGIAYTVGQIIRTMYSLSGRARSPLYYGLTTGLAFSVILYVCLLVVVVAGILKVTFRNPIDSIDENGIRRLKNTTKGASKFLTSNEIKETFQVGKVKDYRADILGKLSENGTEDIVFNEPLEKKGGTGTHNDLVIASMGSGKTFTYVYNTCLQAVNRGESVLLPDPKGECFTRLAPYFKKIGVDVHVLNFTKTGMDYSEFWDCLKEVVDPVTERLSGSRLNIFTETYFQNMSNGGKKDDYWEKSQSNVFRTAISFNAWLKEKAITDGFVSLYKKITKVSDNDEIVSTWTTDLIGFPEMRETIMEKAKEYGYPEDEVMEVINDIQTNSFEHDLTIAETYRILLNFKDYIDDMRAIPDWYEASDQFKIFDSGKEENKEQAIKGTQLALQLFANRTLKNVLSHKGVDLSQINLKQSVIFIIMPDAESTMKPVTSLFFSFAFQDMIDNYDKYEAVSAMTGKENPCIPVTVLMEEFFSIGKIPALPTLVGTIRARKISLKIVIQYYDQLSLMFDSDKVANTIQGACPTTIYLGGTEKSTLNFISWYAGKQTVQSESHREMGGLSVGNTGADTNVSEAERPLITEEEARLWKNKTLVIKQGYQPFKLYPMPWIEHWVFKEGLIHWVQYENGSWDVATEDKASMYTWVPTVRDRVKQEDLDTPKIDDRKVYVETLMRNLKKKKKEKTKDLEDTQELSVEEIEKIKNITVDPETGEVTESNTEQTEDSSDKQPKTKSRKISISSDVTGNPETQKPEQESWDKELGFPTEQKKKPRRRRTGTERSQANRIKF